MALNTPAIAHQSGDANFPHIHTGQKRVITGEKHVPAIWIDPDGCEHWVMDDGVEGYMSPKLDPNGMPTCHRSATPQDTCGGTLSSDTLFATASARLSGQAQQQLKSFFTNRANTGFIITGHTDARGSDAYNMNLSRNRARSVAAVAQSVGARVVDIRGQGERSPIATNSTRQGMAQNRRVDITCVQTGAAQ
ncbi:MAG: OmpA family protein [Pseudomonadota bacterium]